MNFNISLGAVLAVIAIICAVFAALGVIGGTPFIVAAIVLLGLARLT